MKNLLARIFGFLLVVGVPAVAFAADPPPPTTTEQAQGIADTATGVFEAVSILVVAMVAFFIIVRIVKGIRK